MFDFVLEQCADLTVYHAVKLAGHYNIVAQVTVLGKKQNPVKTVSLLVVTGIENDLALINDYQRLPFFAFDMVFEGIVVKKLRLQFQYWDIDKITYLLAPVVIDFIDVDIDRTYYVAPKT